MKILSIVPGGATGDDRRERLFCAFALAIIYVFFLSRFDLKLLFTPTILTGGDSASWLQPLVHLKGDYLPRLRFFGYSHANFFGYLEGQHYFVLPFLAASLLGTVVPLTISLKIATFAGCVVLPYTMYRGVRAISGSRTAGVSASALSLLFLFNESYSMFGGNLLSTFAGEFCYSWAIAILPLYIASVWKDFGTGRFSPKSGLLLACIGLCHLFVFMPAFFLPFFFLFRAGNFRRSPVASAIPLHISGETRNEAPHPGRMAAAILYSTILCLFAMAFWFLPMATTRTWAQSISMIWIFSSFADFASQTLMPVWTAAVLALVGGLLAGGRRDRGLYAFLLYGFFACASMYLIAKFLEIPDIRFIPVALVFSVFTFALIVDRILHLIPGRGMTIVTAVGTLAVMIAVVPVVLLTARNSPGWFAWNYSGYEAKQGWSALGDISVNYRGNIESGRLLWEKQNQRDNADFGSERGFENLYLLTGRPSAEGIHYGSSFMARATTYLQSVYSPEPVDPEAWRLYSRIDPESWPLRFTQANARHIITHTQGITEEFAAHPDFRLDSVSGRYSVFEYRRFPGSYVEIRDPGDISVLDDSPAGFKTDFYRFYRDYELVRHPFVPASFAKEGKSGVRREFEGMPRFRRYDELRTKYRNEPGWKDYAASPGMDLVGVEQVDSFSFSFTTPSPGYPHIVKISYAPGWRSTGGERIYPVAPGFMLIYPESSSVELVYTRSPVEIAGIVLTLLAIPLALLFRRLVNRGLGWYPVFFKLTTAAYCIVLGTLFALSLSGSTRMAADIQKARALDLSNPVARATASRLVTPHARLSVLERNDNLLGFEAFRIKAEVLARNGDLRNAKSLVDLLKDRYPYARALDSLPVIREEP